MSLETTFCGRKIRSPFGAAALALSSPGAQNPKIYTDRILKFIEYGSGIASTFIIREESIKDYPKHKEPTYIWGRINRPEHNYLIAQADAEQIQGRIEVGLELTKILRERCPPDVLVQANVVVHTLEPKQWADHCKAFEDAGADLIELDVSCGADKPGVEPDVPYSWMEGMPAQYISDRPLVLAEIMKAITSVVKIPVGFKMSAETGWPRFLYIAKAAYEAGAKFVSCTNVHIGINGIDIYNRGKPDRDSAQLTKNQFGALVGCSGYAGMKQVAGIKLFVPELDLVGISGIRKPEDVVAYIMLGAQITEVCSGIMYYGGRFIKRVKYFLERFMKEQGYNSIDEMRGLALKEFELDSSKVDYGYGKKLAVTDEAKCTGCGFCVDSQCFASYLENGIAKVNSDECTGCGLCVWICPEEARSLVMREKPRRVGIKALDA